MAWFLGQKEAEERQVYHAHKGELDLTQGPFTDFRSHRSKEIINVQCKTGGKAVKISKFATEKSIGVFARCTTLASFKTQLDRFVGSKESSPECRRCEMSKDQTAEWYSKQCRFKRY